MRKKKSTKKWLGKHSHDQYVRLSQSEGYRSRAYHKLLEIDQKYKILRSSNNIIDLGSSPGSWSQYITREFNDKALIATDLIDMKPIKGVRFIHGDITTDHCREKIMKIMTAADLVLSDIAPNISGIEDVDQANFVEIFESIIGICSNLLKLKGILVMKFFNGSSYDFVLKRLKSVFSEVKVYKPDSSRNKSNEMFFVCIGYKKTDMIEINGQ